MTIDVQRFITAERPTWSELESMLSRLEAEPNARLTLSDVERFHELYERTAASLGRLSTFATEQATRKYLESLIARAYGEIHETRANRRRLYPLKWLLETLPQTFRRRIRAFYLALAVTLAGCAFGAAATVFDPDSRHVIMPFGHDQLRPSERVRQEETRTDSPLAGHYSTFSAFLMTHNIQVSIMTLALGMTWGVGTILMLFYNGIALGAIGVDYIADGQARFLMGWLMPHGAVEIPAILVAGQAGFLLALGLIGWASRMPLAERMRDVSRDVVTLSFGFALLLVWAGFVESFLSQYHEPLVPYEAKIAFGAIELILLCFYLARSGR